MSRGCKACLLLQGLDLGILGLQGIFQLLDLHHHHSLRALGGTCSRSSTIVLITMSAVAGVQHSACGTSSGTLYRDADTWLFKGASLARRGKRGRLTRLANSACFFFATARKRFFTSASSFTSAALLPSASGESLGEASAVPAILVALSLITCAHYTNSTNRHSNEKLRTSLSRAVPCVPKSSTEFS